MKFAIGYQLPDEDGDSFVDVVREFQDHIAEVYFPWADQPSGRAPLSTRRGYTDWQAQEQLEHDLRAFRQLGVGLDLLFNANCYGRYAVSQYPENQVLSVLEHLAESVGGVETVTTSSLAVARTVKRHAPAVEVRASVNMRIGTVEGMRYVGDLFDSYHVQRDVQRDVGYVQELVRWAQVNGKRLYMLANSGCLRNCSGQSFHDNLVAHEKQIDEVANIAEWTPHVCWNFLRDRQAWPAVLQSTWVRPEDLRAYEPLFPVVKLATRMHARPRAVVRAYCEGRFRGNLLDLFEPGFSPLFAPYIVDNDRFPEGWFTRTSTCDRRCHAYGYYAGVLEDVLVRFDQV